MNLEGHIEELKKKHEMLQEKIEVEQKAPGSDDIVIAQMKKEKLRIKDEIERISSQL